MGVQTMQSQRNGQQSHLQPYQLTRQNSWYNLTLNEVENQLGNLGKPLCSMNLDELLKNLWSTGANQSMGMDSESTSMSSLQHQASFTLARALSGKTVNQVWKGIQQGQKKRFGEEMKVQEREQTLGTLSDTTTSGRKRDTPDVLEKSIERRLERKIKNRESAARSRARKQAYHNELVSKFSHLEEGNIRLKKEKEFEKKFPIEPPPEQKYQLRRTSSTSF